MISESTRAYDYCKTNSKTITLLVFVRQQLVSLQSTSYKRLANANTHMETHTHTLTHTQTHTHKYIHGTFPTTWKTAIIKPLIKKAGLDQSSPANYRPVSNLSFLSNSPVKLVDI